MSFQERFNGLELPASADFHVHLRDGTMMETVTPTIRKGGVDTVYVMPNLVPPLTTPAQSLSYKSRLEAIDPSVTYLMSLYLHPSITPEIIREAKAAGITGVKSYPAGVTTNSAAGVVSYEAFYPVFEEMERQNMILNLHGEKPSGEDITVLNAEERFLPTLKEIHKRFPKLRIILEHCTTAAALKTVMECGPTVAGTITAHHLFLTVDDWASDPFCFCKPVAKLPSDREALLKAAAANSPKIFLGTDSAPHPATAKRGGADGKGKTVAGVFTQPYATQLAVGAFEKAIEKGWLKDNEVTVDVVRGFLGENGRKFYGVPQSESRIVLRKGEEKVVEAFASKGGELEVVPFRRGEPTWSVEWK
ncbi:Dihydroorotase [Xylona heveae TC161]|uniref:dihydroorotase n=1 Tax=Xylona heveae (strain CBS 132557 / TC161) TaxID=1328760 RepID=A0A164ZVH2_XYLHT|nr:Dihydroorotase [Xylona heveae TC161]KZF19586.1 Dihydroorotase [Xylona heveae TC161]